MPVYVYEIVKQGGRPGKRFEIMQKISDPPLERHPKTGEPVRRVLFAPYTPQFKYDRAMKQIEREDRHPARKKTAAQKRKKR